MRSKTKYKLSELAKDIGAGSAEVAELLLKLDGAQRKTAAMLAPEEISYVLEYYTQNNQVESFDEYFARNVKPAYPPDTPDTPDTAAQEPKAEKPKNKPSKSAKAEGKPPKSEKPEQTENVKAAKNKPVKQENTKAENAVSEPVKLESVKSEAVKTESAKTQSVQKDNAKAKDVGEQAKAKKPSAEQSDKNKKNKNKNKDKPKKQDKGEKKTLVGKSGSDDKGYTLSSASDKQSYRTVDTRGSYVELDKYNEKYDNLAISKQGGQKTEDNPEIAAA